MRTSRIFLAVCLLISSQSLFAQLTNDGTGYYSPYDITLGDANSTVGMGKKISFGYNGNTDPLWIGRYNVASDITEMRVNISDDGQATDRFIVGYQPYSAPWFTAMSVGANGQSIFGNGCRIYQGAYDGVSLYGDFRTNTGSGNMVLSAPANALFLNYDHGTNGVNFGDGQSNITARVEPNGAAWFNGKVAIGTPIGNQNTQLYRLAVNGDAIFTRVLVKAYPFPDYVFNSSYRLRSLDEVEQYIKQYHHLPEVPAAAAVEKNGLDVGDNQVTLLKKIEELTLYMIEQNKNQQAQQKQLQKLSERVNMLQKENQQLKKQIKAKQ
jgi:hypothetical protein